MKKAIVFAGLCLVAVGPAWATGTKPTRITCETVRAFVAQVGAQEARAVALAHGMTAGEERLARRCLEE